MTHFTVGSGSAAVGYDINDDLASATRRSNLGDHLTAARASGASARVSLGGTDVTLTQSMLQQLETATSTAQRVALLEGWLAGMPSAHDNAIRTLAALQTWSNIPAANAGGVAALSLDAHSNRPGAIVYPAPRAPARPTLAPRPTTVAPPPTSVSLTPPTSIARPTVPENDPVALLQRLSHAAANGDPAGMLQIQIGGDTISIDFARADAPPVPSDPAALRSWLSTSLARSGHPVSAQQLDNLVYGLSHARLGAAGVEQRIGVEVFADRPNARGNVEQMIDLPPP